MQPAAILAPSTSFGSEPVLWGAARAGTEECRLQVEQSQPIHVQTQRRAICFPVSASVLSTPGTRTSSISSSHMSSIRSDTPGGPICPVRGRGSLAVTAVQCGGQRRPCCQAPIVGRTGRRRRGVSPWLACALLEHGHFRNRHHELTAPATNMGHLRDDLVLHVPRQDEDVVRLRFRDALGCENRDVRAGQ